MKLTDAQLQRALLLLRIKQDDFTDIVNAPTMAEGQQRLAELKARVKKQFRTLAFDLHPDRTNNDPAKTDDFKLVSVVAEDLQEVELRPKPLPRQVFTIRITTHGGTVTSTSWNGHGF